MLQNTSTKAHVQNYPLKHFFTLSCFVVFPFSSFSVILQTSIFCQPSLCSLPSPLCHLELKLVALVVMVIILSALQVASPLSGTKGCQFNFLALNIFWVQIASLVIMPPLTVSLCFCSCAQSVTVFWFWHVFVVDENVVLCHMLLHVVMFWTSLISHYPINSQGQTAI